MFSCCRCTNIKPKLVSEDEDKDFEYFKPKDDNFKDCVETKLNPNNIKVIKNSNENLNLVVNEICTKNDKKLHAIDVPKDNSKENCNENITTTTNISDNIQKSCLLRKTSSKSSIKKKVNINDNSNEIMQSPELLSIEDDEVFSDSIPVKNSRVNMCAPYLFKHGSVPDNFGLPDWFNIERSENNGSIEPPVTPVGRDELALKRHRMYSDLLIAAQAAVEHRVRFDPLGPDFDTSDCDPDTRPSTAAELNHLLDRFEKLVERLERSISARELHIVNKTIDSVINNKIENCDLEKINSLSKNQNDNIEIITNFLHSNKNLDKISDENLPRVLNEFLTDKSTIIEIENMSIRGYEDIINGPLQNYLNLSKKIGGDVAVHASFVKSAFNAQLQFITFAAKSAKPTEQQLTQFLKPTSEQITAIQNFREKNRTSSYFNHLSAVSESIPALGWVCVSPTPGPHVKEMNDAGQFYTNRVLKEWKEKDQTHVEWTKSWIQTLTQLQQYIKQYHTTGLVWSGKGTAPLPPPSGMCPPPPPPPEMDFNELSLNPNDERSALFAEINQGEGITKNLKKVTADMQTHKNTTLRTGPAPFKAPQPFSTTKTATTIQQTIDKPPVFNRDGKKWIIEYQKSNTGLRVENAEMNNVVYMFKCLDSTLTIKGKINSVVMDSCKKCSVLFDSVVSSIEFVNCQSVQMQVLGTVPTISIDKTDGCQMYLSKESLGVAIISSKSSEMNVMIPKNNGEFTEQPIPEQYKTTIKGNTLVTNCVESLG